MFPGYTVELPHVSFRLVPEILNTVDVIDPVSEHFAVVDPIVLKLGNIQHVVVVKTVGVYDAVREDLLLHDRHQRG